MLRNALWAAASTGVLAGAWWLLFRQWPWVGAWVTFGVYVVGMVLAMTVMQWRTTRRVKR
ncbi:hypothetical protein ACQFX6_16900 [Streptomyces sp. DSM 41987]|uniref:hypothetical protein n=1 Tax=Streptomyces TaxID=1883 RepID=UPI003618F9E9